MTRAERIEAVLRLREGGMLQREIAEALGLSRSYVCELLNDPDGSRLRSRRDRYRGECDECGGPTSRGGWTRCRQCELNERTENRLWDDDAVIERIRAWADLYGRPPSARDWNPSNARTQGRDDVAERFYADGCWPHLTTVQRMFGSWNVAITAAGFAPRKTRGADIPPAVSLASVTA